MKRYEKFFLNNKEGEVTATGMVSWDGGTWVLSEIQHRPLYEKAYQAYCKLHGSDEEEDFADE
jgi:hypothetical protein